MDLRQLRPSTAVGLLSLPLGIGFALVAPFFVLSEGRLSIVVPLVVTGAVGGLAWLLNRRPLRFGHALGVASVAFVSLVPLTAMTLGGRTLTPLPNVADYWRVPLDVHALAVLPVVLMFALGVARTRRQRLATFGLMFVPTVFGIVDATLTPSPRGLTRPLVDATLRVLLFFVVASYGGPLFVFGRLLSSSRQNLRDRLLRRPAGDA